MRTAYKWMMMVVVTGMMARWPHYHWPVRWLCLMALVFWVRIMWEWDDPRRN